MPVIKILSEPERPTPSDGGEKYKIDTLKETPEATMGDKFERKNSEFDLEQAYEDFVVNSI